MAKKPKAYIYIEELDKKGFFTAGISGTGEELTAMIEEVVTKIGENDPKQTQLIMDVISQKVDRLLSDIAKNKLS